MPTCSPGRKYIPLAVAVVTSVLVLGASAVQADDASEFGMFMGLSLAIEDKCEQYFLRTDAAMGDHLSAVEHDHASSMVETERAKALQVVDKLGCERAADEAAKLARKPFAQVWEVR